MDKVTRQCPQTTTVLKRKESRSSIEPRSLCLPAYRLTASPNRLSEWIRTDLPRHHDWSTREREITLVISPFKRYQATRPDVALFLDLNVPSSAQGYLWTNHTFTIPRHQFQASHQTTSKTEANSSGHNTVNSNRNQTKNLLSTPSLSQCLYFT